MFHSCLIVNPIKGNEIKISRNCSFTGYNFYVNNTGNPFCFFAFLCILNVNKKLIAGLQDKNFKCITKIEIKTLF